MTPLDAPSLFLAGGGADAPEGERAFVAALRPRKILVYLPLAQPSGEHLAGLETFGAAMATLGAHRLVMVTGMQPPPPVEDIAGVAIGDGDPARLLAAVHEAQLAAVLRECAHAGVPLYGIGAGAMLLGKDARTTPDAAHLESRAARGLDLLRGYSVLPRWSGAAQDAQRLARDLGLPILAIPSGGGAGITGDQLTCLGAEALGIATPQDTQVLPPGARMRLATPVPGLP